jgi:Protein of unknown function (DUF3455)
MSPIHTCLPRLRVARRILSAALLAACALTASAASASSGTPPRPPAGNALLFSTEAFGAQIYQCQNNATWALRSPDAIVLDAFARQQVVRHYGAIDRPGVFAGPGPIWQSEIDGSAVRGRVVSSIPNPGSIPLLLLDIAEYQGSGLLRDVTYIVRDNTWGGLSPTGSCTPGQTRRIPYTSNYRFYAPTSVVLRGIPASLIPVNQSFRFKFDARGSQIYECAAPTSNPNVFTWRFLAPQASLYETVGGRLIGFHYGGILVGRTSGPWWEVGGGAVRGSVTSQVANSGTIPSLLLNIVERDGSNTTFNGSNSIVRYNLTGGLIPTRACARGEQLAVPYTTTYAFFGTALE